MPLVTIIIPSYNSEKTLHRCISSIISQSFTDFEVLFVDGQSKDKTLEIIKEYQSKYAFIKYTCECDRGIYDAMNKGIDRAYGDWILFMGSDDELYDNTVLEKVFSSDVTTQDNIIYGNVKIINSNSWAIDGSIYDGVFDTHKLLNRNICHQAIFYKTDFVKAEIGYYNLNYRVCADWDFNLRCWAKTPFKYADIIIAKFYAGGESSINQMDEAFSNEFLGNILLYFNISPFDRIVNDVTFIQYHKVLLLQKRQNYLRYFVNRVQQRLLTR
jgi:glycosyltransferase involved in cell wall biosynthesis